MIIIFEGPDNVGKTTQVKKLFQHFIRSQQLCHLVHCSDVGIKTASQCIDVSKKYYYRTLKLCERLTRGGDNIILDRSHLGEWVYGFIYRKYDADWIFDLETYIELDDVYVFNLLVEDPNILIHREDGESISIDSSDKKLEMNRFIEASKKSHIQNTFNIYCDLKTPEAIHLEILNHLNRQKGDETYV